MWMNEFDIDQEYRQYKDHAVLGPAVRTMVSLRDWTNNNSDGWCYWPKPSRAARRLQEMIMRDGTSAYRFDEERHDVSRAELTKALAPVKAFRTRCMAKGMPDFRIYEAS